MFKVYDSNFKEVKIPVDRLGFGSRALEINVGPVIYENVYSQSRRADTLVKRYAKDRQVSIVLMVSGMDETDFRMKRDSLYSFFRNLGVFFVAEEQQPFKLIKVIVNDDYDIDRQTPEIAIPEILLKIIDTPFKQSLHTTSEIDAEGIRWNNKWAYGMGLSSDKPEWGYSYDPNPTAVNLDKTMFEQGSMFISNGQNADGNTQLGRLKNHYSVIKGQNYQLNLSETGGTINYIRIFHYDASGNHISNEGTSNVRGNGNTSLPFVALGTSIRLLIYADGSAQVDISGIGTLTQISIGGYLNLYHPIKFFNAGTEPVKLIQQKESEVRIDIKSSTNWFEIYDGETTFRLNKAVKSGDVLRIRGHTITLNGNNVMGETNFNFMTVKKGWNEWEIRNLQDFEFSIDFRFLYD